MLVLCTWHRYGKLSLTTMSLEFENTSRECAIIAGTILAHEGVNANLTRYLPIAGAHLIDTTEANSQMKARHSFTISGLSIKVITNTVTAASTLTLRKNAVDTALIATITASTTGVFSDTSNSVTVTDSDQISLEITTGATGTTISYSRLLLICQSHKPSSNKKSYRNYHNIRVSI